MSKEQKHTPGPWKAHLNVPTAVIEGHIIKVDDEVARPIASLWVGGGTEGKPTQVANAHLIAAAPDMLEALEAMLPIYQDLYENHDPEGEIAVHIEFDIAATDAIAKAKGGQA